MTFGGNAAGDVVGAGESANAYHRCVNEARALRLLRVALDYIPNRSFEDPACRAEILGPDPDLSVSGASHCAPATGGRFRGGRTGAISELAGARAKEMRSGIWCRKSLRRRFRLR